MNKPCISSKICFISLSAYPLLLGKNAKRIVGPDVHQVILARELIKRNFKVSFVAYGEGNTPIEYIDGIKIIKIYQDTHRLKSMHVIFTVFRIWNAMRRAKADIYFHNGGASGPGSLFCRMMRKRYVYYVSSDALANRRLITKKIKEFNRSIFSFGAIGNWLDIKLADRVIVKNEYQQAMLKKNFAKDAVLLQIPFPLSAPETPEKANPPIVLWVGTTAEVKQPELFVKLAEAIPETVFQMIAGSFDNQQLHRIKESSKKLSNFQFLGTIPFNKINEYFNHAAILVNTSMFEGFPTIASIQAWMNYTPVVILNADPDEIICKYKLGFDSKTFNQLVEDVKTLLKDEQLRKEMGKNGRQYVEKEHDITKVVDKYIEVFNRL